MIQKTVIIVGPGGIGKSPIDSLLRDDIIKLDPYRLRPQGPRHASDVLYVHPKLRTELLVLLKQMGDSPIKLKCDKEDIEWYPKFMVLFFTVRGVWQLLMLRGVDGQVAKAEIYAPILLSLLNIQNIRSLLGQSEVVILNPSSQRLTVMQNWKDIEDKTEDNCTRRGDSTKSIRKRVNSIVMEAPAWKELINNQNGTEFSNWEFLEYKYKTPPSGISLIDHQKDILKKVRKCLITANFALTSFFKSEDDIDQIKEPFV